jgi:tight adherence protein C
MGGLIIGALVFLLGAVHTFRRRREAPPPMEDSVVLPGLEGTKPTRFGKMGAMLRPTDAKTAEELQNRLARAGLYGRDAIDLYLSIRLSALIGGLIIAVMAIQGVGDPLIALFFFLLIMGGAFLAPSIWLDMRAKSRQRAITEALPPSLDLLVTCLDAGLNLEQALARISSGSEIGKDLLSTELNITLEEIRAGLSVSVAFRRLANRLGSDEVQNLAALIAQATAMGANLADALRAHAQTMRKHRIVFLEEVAGKANAKLTLPLTLCLLPSVLVLLMGPALLMMSRSF